MWGWVELPAAGLRWPLRRQKHRQCVRSDPEMNFQGYSAFLACRCGHWGWVELPAAGLRWPLRRQKHRQCVWSDPEMNFQGYSGMLACQRGHWVWVQLLAAWLKQLPRCQAGCLCARNVLPNRPHDSLISALHIFDHHIFLGVTVLAYLLLIIHHPLVHVPLEVSP